MIEFRGHMIEFTKEEVIELLKHLSRVEGTMLNSNMPEEIWDQFDYYSNILTKKLMEEEK